MNFVIIARTLDLLIVKDAIKTMFLTKKNVEKLVLKKLLFILITKKNIPHVKIVIKTVKFVMVKKKITV